MPSRARTNWPVKGSPHFLQVRTWPLAERPLLWRDLFLSLLFRGASSCQGAPCSEPGSEGLGLEFVSLSLWLLSGVCRSAEGQDLSPASVTGWSLSPRARLAGSPLLAESAAMLTGIQARRCQEAPRSAMRAVFVVEREMKAWIRFILNSRCIPRVGSARKRFKIGAERG